jgi:hypothetical protein
MRSTEDLNERLFSSLLENGPQGVSRAMNSFDLKDDLFFDHSQLLLSKEVLVNPSSVLGKPSFS